MQMSAPCGAVGMGDQPIGPIREPSDNIGCDPRTNFVRVDDTAAIGGQFFSITLCEVPNLQGCSPSGPNGGCLVNSRISGATFAMVEAAQLAGITVRGTSTYRSLEQQSAVRVRNGLSACTREGAHLPPQNQGTALVGSCNGSFHRSGRAIDFDMAGCSVVYTGAANWPSHCSPGSSPLFDWLYSQDNASRFGFSKLNSEYWHFDVGNFQ
jgi:hypothetical protein